MKQIKNDTEARIVHAAVQLFSHKGYSATRTREIARLACVNEASLFHHFTTKEDLFWAAIRSCLDRMRIAKELQAGLLRNEEPEQVVPLIVELLVQTAIYHPELVRLFSTGLLELRSGTEALYREYLAPTFQSISKYLERCIENNTVRGLEPDVTLTAIATTILSRPLYGLPMGASEHCSCAQEAIATYSQFWLSALIPSYDANASSRKLSSVSRRTVGVSQRAMMKS